MAVTNRVGRTNRLLNLFRDKTLFIVQRGPIISMGKQALVVRIAVRGYDWR
jgi:hypothetical protein